MRRPLSCAPLLALCASGNLAQAQVLQSPIQLEPFPATSYSNGGTNVVTVQNHYGRCGPSVVQVHGVARDNGDFFGIDPNAGARVVVIREAGRRELVLSDVFSDHNGVACVNNRGKRYLLIWSNCGGTACGDDFSFTVVDVDVPRVVAGGNTECDARCAARITGSRIPTDLNNR